MLRNFGMPMADLYQAGLRQQCALPANQWARSVKRIIRRNACAGRSSDSAESRRAHGGPITAISAQGQRVWTSGGAKQQAALRQWSHKGDPRCSIPLDSMGEPHSLKDFLRVWHMLMPWPPLTDYMLQILARLLWRLGSHELGAVAVCTCTYSTPSYNTCRKSRCIALHVMAGAL